MKKAKPQGVIGSAECARRAGLTVRALRVYERAGLIKPQRGANGWRGYGQDELRRLNHIITLKSLGLSLREIRGVLGAPVPTSLKSILELQLRSWLTRQAATLQALKLVNAALERLAANQSLSIDELCELASLSTAYIAKTEHEGEWLDLTPAEQAPHRFLADALRGSVKSAA